MLDLPTAYWHEVVLALDAEGLEMPRVVNTYGPTEATIVSTGQDLGEEAGELPIGRPVAQARVALLGPHREPPRRQPEQPRFVGIPPFTQ